MQSLSHLDEGRHSGSIVACHRAAYPEYPKNAYYNERFYEMQLPPFPKASFWPRRTAK
jgi:hypothetical protein